MTPLALFFTVSSQRRAYGQHCRDGRLRRSQRTLTVACETRVSKRKEKRQDPTVRSPDRQTPVRIVGASSYGPRRARRAASRCRRLPQPSLSGYPHPLAWAATRPHPRPGILCPCQPMPLRVSSSACSPLQSSPRPPESGHTSSCSGGAIDGGCVHD